MENKETGEITGNIVRIKSNTNVNVETGEIEPGLGISKPCFKIPIIKKEHKAFKRPKPNQKICCIILQKYCILLVCFTLSVILPSLVMPLWLFTECVSHIYMHRIKASGNPFIRSIFISHFCAQCQSEKCMSVVGKLQDERTIKMKQYFKNIPFGT